MGAILDKPQWKKIVHVWGSITELTLPPHRRISVKFEVGTEGQYSYNETIAELKRQGSLSLLSNNHMSPTELEHENAFLRFLKQQTTM